MSTVRLTGQLLTIATLVAIGALCAVGELWPLSLAIGGVAAVLADAALYGREKARQALAWGQRAELAARPPTPADDDAVAIAIASACCSIWWTSTGTDHTVNCRTRSPR